MIVHLYHSQQFHMQPSFSTVEQLTIVLLPKYFHLYPTYKTCRMSLFLQNWSVPIFVLHVLLCIYPSHFLSLMVRRSAIVFVCNLPFSSYTHDVIYASSLFISLMVIRPFEGHSSLSNRWAITSGRLCPTRWCDRGDLCQENTQIVSAASLIFRLCCSVICLSIFQMFYARFSIVLKSWRF